MAKPKCNSDVIKNAVKMKKSGVNNRDITRALNISETTFYAWMNQPKTKNQYEFSEALKKAETEYKANLQQLILDAAKERDWKAAAWLLERKYPQEFAKTVRVPSTDDLETEDADALFKSAGLDA